MVVGMLAAASGCMTSSEQAHLNDVERKYERLGTEYVNLKAEAAQKDQKIKDLIADNAKLTEANRDLAEKLKQKLPYIEKEKIVYREVKVNALDLPQGVTAKDNRLIVAANVMFDSGQYKLKPQGQESLKRVAQILRDKYAECNFRIEGHTDDQPVEKSLKWGVRDNWDLSLKRAYAVFKELKNCGLKEEKMSIAGYGPYRPIASNKATADRAQNRRCEIVILPDIKLKREKLLADK